MTGGLIALAIVVIAATVAGVALRRRSGRFRPAAPAAPADDQSPFVLTAADLGAPLGDRATLVQFSTAFCAKCRPTRLILARVASQQDGVAHIDIDAASRLDLARRLRIASTPAVLVLGSDGAIVRRATGLPRESDVIAALAAAIPAAPA